MLHQQNASMQMGTYATATSDASRVLAVQAMLGNIRQLLALCLCCSLCGSQQMSEEFVHDT